MTESEKRVSELCKTNIGLVAELMEEKKKRRLAQQVSFTAMLALEEAKITIREKDKLVDYWRERSRTDLLRHIA